MIRDATVGDLEQVAALIRALADYEEMADEVEWDLDQLRSDAVRARRRAPHARRRRRRDR